MDQPRASKLSQLDTRCTYKPDQLPRDLNLNQLKILKAKQTRNGKAVMLNPQRVVVGKSGGKVQLDLVTEDPNPKKTKG
ncbi:hypothetical protein V6C27_05050 [Peptococcaceae bacterium 1198_IL3148]